MITWNFFEKSLTYKLKVQDTALQINTKTVLFANCVHLIAISGEGGQLKLLPYTVKFVCIFKETTETSRHTIMVYNTTVLYWTWTVALDGSRMKIHVGPTVWPCCSGTGQLHLMAPVGLARGPLGTRSVFIEVSVNSYLVRVSLITVKSIAPRFYLCLFGVECCV